MSEQLRLFEPERAPQEAEGRAGLTDPLTCPHAGRIWEEFDRIWCERGEFWTDCQKEHWGEPPQCAFDPPDNSPEAKARRVAWCKENE